MGLLDRLKHMHVNSDDEEAEKQQYRPPSGPPPPSKSQQREEYQAPAGPPPYARNVQDEKYQPPPGPPPRSRQHVTEEEYLPPQGPPPRSKAYQEEHYQPPSGPPPRKEYRGDEQYQPPPGPPPRREQRGDAQYQPPSGSPPGQIQQAKADEANGYQLHNWQAIPDTSLLPPPPSLDHGPSATSNASPDLARLAWNWTDRNPPFPPTQPPKNCIDDVRNGNLSLRPPEHGVAGEQLSQRSAICDIKTTSRSRDHTYLSSLPLYFERVDSPFRTNVKKIIYYELKIMNMKTLPSGEDSSVAIGYAVAPYPTWRMPGWQRGSLAIHSDDGSRFMSHDAGGFDFTSPIRTGEVVGLGICFSIPDFRPDRQLDSNVTSQPLKGEVFFTRNGRPAGGWDIQEGLDDLQGWRADFLDGKWDLYAAIGTYGEVEVSVRFAAHEWGFNPTRFNGLPDWMGGRTR